MARQFAIILRQEDVKIDVRSILGTLAGTDTPEEQTFKERFFEACQTLSRHMAFLLPQEVTAHLAGLKSLKWDGTIEDGHVYNTISEDVIP